MEEGKAAAYYEELTRKGDGAARFKQGLGFSTSSSSSVPKSSSPSSAHFSNFVRASSPSKAEKQAQLVNIQAKLRGSRRSPSPNFRYSETRYRSRERDGSHQRRSSSKERRRERDRDRGSYSEDRRRSSRGYSSEEERKEHRHSRGGGRERESSQRGIRSRSPSRISSCWDLNDDHRREDRSSGHRISAKKDDKLNYRRLIQGYSQMTPAERVKAKMKLQLSQTAAKDSTMSMSNGWERFDFNKDAPLDDHDDEIEVAEDDVSLVKEIGSTFRFSAVQAKREGEIKAAHDEAMFGASVAAPYAPVSVFGKVDSDDKDDDHDGTVMTNIEKQDNNIFISEKVLVMQQGSWRDRVGKFKSGFGS